MHKTNIIYQGSRELIIIIIVIKRSTGVYRQGQPLLLSNEAVLLDFRIRCDFQAFPPNLNV
jgi:hypothetical protein